MDNNGLVLPGSTEVWVVKGQGNPLVSTHPPQLFHFKKSAGSSATSSNEFTLDAITLVVRPARFSSFVCKSVFPGSSLTYPPYPKVELFPTFHYVKRILYSFKYESIITTYCNHIMYQHWLPKSC
ncbi:hypothetical protein L798_14499 [Zootermopsis nevadensis]|uniref:Uncharacterized protein n=1 Tax=Zootermopsis nevadensis TaxID=136037 RepID=A0A067RS34_ZOONE|nr:hypothetical protein L798_14499 [Zootermopsis nevadensis]